MNLDGLTNSWAFQEALADDRLAAWLVDRGLNAYVAPPAPEAGVAHLYTRAGLASAADEVDLTVAPIHGGSTRDVAVWRVVAISGIGPPPSIRSGAPFARTRNPIVGSLITSGRFTLHARHRDRWKQTVPIAGIEAMRQEVGQLAVELHDPLRQHGVHAGHVIHRLLQAVHLAVTHDEIAYAAGGQLPCNVINGGLCGEE